jgi:hypothetical protein
MIVYEPGDVERKRKDNAETLSAQRFGEEI